MPFSVLPCNNSTQGLSFAQSSAKQSKREHRRRPFPPAERQCRRGGLDLLAQVSIVEAMACFRLLKRARKHGRHRFSNFDVWRSRESGDVALFVNGLPVFIRFTLFKRHGFFTDRTLGMPVASGLNMGHGLPPGKRTI